MPRKSAAALAAEAWRLSNAPPPPPHPEPPAWLSEAAARHWRAIVASRPPAYWAPPSGEFLAFLCCHIATSDVIWRELSALDLADPKQLRRCRALSVMASRESRMIALLLTKLRLLPPKMPPAPPSTNANRRPWSAVE
jgi:hypothetical protein